MLPSDVRYSFRVLRKSPVASISAQLTLAATIAFVAAIAHWAPACAALDVDPAKSLRSE
ncbi:MAG: hypothetical protein ACRD8O_00505 [Bryobacteraceae bacterium]